MYKIVIGFLICILFIGLFFIIYKNERAEKINSENKDETIEDITFEQSKIYSDLEIESSENKEVCEMRGGIWSNNRFLATDCLVPSEDAGKDCTDSSQCRYYCAPSYNAAPGESDVGKCAQLPNACSYAYEVRDGIYYAQPCAV